MSYLNRKCFCIVTLFIIQFALMGSSCASGTGQAEIQYSSERLNLTIELDRETYEPEDQIIVKCRLENASDRTISLFPILFMDLSVYLKHEDDKDTEQIYPNILFDEIIRKEDITVLEPGEHHIFDWFIDKRIYGMPVKSGQYELYMIYSNLSEELDGIPVWTGEVRSNTVRFEIRQSHL